MNNEEFEKYLKSYGKSKGEFTKAEIYEIGKVYKATTCKKDWNWLCNEVGWSTGENLRTYVKNKLKKEGKLKGRELTSNVDTVFDTMAENVLRGKAAVGEDVEKNIDDKIVALYKEQIKYKDILNAYKKHIRDEARIELIRDALKEGVSKEKPMPKYEFKDLINRTSKSEACLLVSDLHIGVDCDNYYNTYNLKEASKRLSTLAEETVRYCQMNKVKRLTVLHLGDAIHGIIHTNARIEQEMNAVDQTKRAYELLAQFLNSLQVAAPEIVYRSVLDNHSRLNANKEDHIELESLASLGDWWLELRLKDSNIKFPHDNIDAGIIWFKLENGERVAAVHGHEDRKASIVQDITGLTREVPNYIFVAHYHNSAEHTFQDTKVYVNGSVVGTEQYAFSKRLFSKPEQKLIIFDDKNVLDINIRLN